MTQLPRVSSCVPLLLLLGCGLSDDGGGKPSESPAPEDTACASILVCYPDQDGDGLGREEGREELCECPEGFVTEAGDCDDDDGAVHPGADEACDTVDNNCDGAIDEGLAILTWWTDLDGDGYGSGASQSGCEIPTGSSATDGDCDDADATVFPGATEVCNDADDDCNGEVNEGWFEDADGDGVGDASTEAACDPAAASDEGGDCDDTNADTYPGAPEICDDGLVQDCEGTEEEALAACTWSGDVDLSDADAKLIGEESSDHAGWSVSTAGDVDGDGCADLLVGAPSQGAGGSSAGAAYLVLGPLTGDVDLSDANAKLIGEESSDHTGGSVSTAGDVDGDGCADLLVGAPYQDAGGSYAGAAYLVLGPLTGDVDLSHADAKLIGEESDDEAGSSISTAGDVDGDGGADLLVGAPYQGAGGSYAGAAYLVLGPVTGDVDLSDADAKLIGEGISDEIAGRSVSTAGDVDGDGGADLLVGAPYKFAGGDKVGAAYLVLGPVTGDVDLSDADATLSGEEFGDYAGFSVSTAGDVDADGSADLLVGAFGQEAGGHYAGAAYLLLSPVTGIVDLSDADAKLIGEESGDKAGRSVSTAGDVDGDERADLLVGAYSQDAGSSDAGAAYLLLSHSF